MQLTEYQRILGQFDEELQKLEIIANSRQPAKILERERAKEDIKVLQKERSKYEKKLKEAEKEDEGVREKIKEKEKEYALMIQSVENEIDETYNNLFESLKERLPEIEKKREEVGILRQQSQGISGKSGGPVWNVLDSIKQK